MNKNNPMEAAAMCAELEKWSMEERSEGRLEGRAEGRVQGAEQLAGLLKLLQADGRTEDIKLALEDKNARERLYKEYHIE